MSALLKFCFFLVALHEVLSIDYCDLCDGQHTVCKNPTCELRGECRNVPQKPMTDSDRKLLLDTHNELRNKVALGQEPNLPTAADMNVLTWNSELEMIAQCWMNTCGSGHDSCRNTHEFYVGQNGFARGQTPSMEFPPDVYGHAVGAWYNEVSRFDPAEIDKFTGKSSAGHFTQVIWSKTEYLGCGSRIKKDDKWYWLDIFCNYGAGGNILGAAIYKKGAPCSQCSRNQGCDNQYKGLCKSAGSVRQFENPTHTYDNIIPLFSAMFSKNITAEEYEEMIY